MNSIDDILQQELDDVMNAEFRKRKQIRCQAHLSHESMARRHAHGDRRCRHSAVQQQGDWWFCRQHAPLWAIHQDIVERILSIPARD